MGRTSNSLRNWDGSVTTRPAALVRPATVDELRAIITNPRRYPSPLRAMGAYSSITRCGVADRGTVVDMRALDKVIQITADRVRVQAGARLQDVAKELAQRGLEFAANPSPAGMSMGTAACGETYAPALPGESGQLSSLVVAIKLITPGGEILEVGEEKPDLLKFLRTSYGLLGVAYEITFRVRPIRTVEIRYDHLPLAGFLELLNRLDLTAVSVGLQLFPFRHKVAVEYRKAASQTRSSRRLLWSMRRWSLQRLQPYVGGIISRGVPIPGLRYSMIDGLNDALCKGFDRAVSGAGSTTRDRLLRWPGAGKVRHSVWVFPAHGFGRILREYVDFCHQHYDDSGYRCSLPTGCEFVAADGSSLLSLSAQGPVFTLEPRSTAGEGWDDFVVDFNDFCSARGGRPLFNQTPGLSREHIRKAFNGRLAGFGKLRRRIDPHGRFINAYFEQLLT